MKGFKRVYLTIDNDVIQYLGLDPETVTAAQLRKRLREIVKMLKTSNIQVKQGS